MRVDNYGLQNNQKHAVKRDQTQHWAIIEIFNKEMSLICLLLGWEWKHLSIYKLEESFQSLEKFPSILKNVLIGKEIDRWWVVHSSLLILRNSWSRTFLKNYNVIIRIWICKGLKKLTFQVYLHIEGIN